ncbi:MAG: ATP-dependent DNA helicase RecG [Pseudomonadota bacterium]
MSQGRPEILFPLFAPLTGLPGVGPKIEKLFERLDITLPAHLALTLPVNVEDRRLRDSLDGVVSGEMVTVLGEIGRHVPGRTSSQPYRIQVVGAGTTFELIYFRAKRDWLEQSLPPGARRVISGRIETWEGRLQMPHPDHVLTEEQADTLPPWEPVYPLTQGLSQRVYARAVQGLLAELPDLPEWQANAATGDRNWPGWAAAVREAHAPQGLDALAPGAPARARLAYDELLSHQLALQLVRARMRRGKGQVNAGDGHLRDKAMAAFGHPPTGAQTRAMAEISGDMSAETRMMRLLQGDVGAGKTLVALSAMLQAVEAGGQAAMMAPTEILARQHAAGLADLAQAAGVHLTLLTGRDTGAQRREKLEAMAQGRAQLIIGTHALFQKGVEFQDLRLIIVDEQHRFGVRQRMELAAKAPAGADVLVMTATPIPRTLALAGFGDLDISVLDEKPPGRQPVETALVSMARTGDVVARLRAVLAEGQRAYWVCPLVSESDATEMVAAEARYADLVQSLGAERVRLVHGQMPPDQKDAAMADFQAGRAQVLVATTVIEVGVDVPEATIMVIEQAERFGLAQLHQLRGRVGRGRARSYCLLLYAPPLGEAARSRLEIMRETEDGFRIAEEDLRLRGAGDVLGTQQSGLPKFRIADIARDTELMALARDDARMVLSTDPDLTSDRGNALKALLYLMARDESVRLLRAG